ncbi:MAG: sigma-70 family RNA polymerase sigma factor [Bacteroidota bacterium]
MQIPLATTYTEDKSLKWVKGALAGDRASLEQLIQEHQPFIYNVAWKMAHNKEDALDLTQEVLIKVVTKLSQFKFNSSFRTWLYRIVVNEFLQARRRNAEKTFSTFDEYGDRLDAIPNPELTIEEEISLKELSREMQISCMSGMLMCLTREQRLIYILGDTFGIDHKMGADIFEISKENFRVKLHRARKDLYNFMNNKCGLVNKSNPCRCPKKAKVMAQQGYLDPNRMQFNLTHKHRIADYAQEHHRDLMDMMIDKYTKLFRDHHVQREFDQKTFIASMLEDDDFMSFFESEPSRED